MTPEGKIAAHLVRRCRELALEQRKLSYEGRRGAPDRMVWGRGRLAFIELKAPGEKPRRQQEHELRRLSTSGAVVGIASTTEEVDRLLKTFGEKDETSDY